MVLVLCLLFDDPLYLYKVSWKFLGLLSNVALYLYKISWKYLKGFQRYWVDMISNSQFFKGD